MTISKYNLGLKLWSTNDFYISDAAKLYKKGLYKYIELSVVPNSFNNYISDWKKLAIPFVIHAPHFMNGMNLADKNHWEKNNTLSSEAICYADELQADIIIFHPGVNGDIKETARQIKRINDNRIVIENKPYHALDNLGVCAGYSPDMIEFIKRTCRAGFCLDIGHAIYAANALKIDPLSYIKDFMALEPKIYHLSDGPHNETFDQHMHLGKGSFDLKKIVNEINTNMPITLETPKEQRTGLRDFIEDVSYIESCRTSDAFECA
jgi:endonuclease IV